jgi:protein-tyrosine phosphatase
MKNRVLPFMGIHNFRDYGGYTGKSGGRMKMGLLFRSGQHLDATSDDLENVAALKLATVIDLRGDSERASYPCPRPSIFNAAVLHAHGDTAGPHVPLDQPRPDVQVAADAKAAMLHLYRDMPFRPRLIEVYRHYIAALGDRGGPSLVHCLAGKDRTGLIVALFHHLLGVHPDDIMADYLLTNVVGDIDARIAAGANAVRGSFGADMDDAAVRTLMSVAPEYLDAAFAAILDRYGSIETYAQEVLGVTPALRGRMIDIYLT